MLGRLLGLSGHGGVGHRLVPGLGLVEGRVMMCTWAVAGSLFWVEKG